MKLNISRAYSGTNEGLLKENFLYIGEVRNAWVLQVRPEGKLDEVASEGTAVRLVCFMMPFKGKRGPSPSGGGSWLLLYYRIISGF